MATKPQTLTEACAPVFLYLTTFRRNSATSTQSIEDLQRSLKEEIERTRATCDQDHRLRPLFDRMFYALIVAIDQIVLSSDWTQRAGWSMRLLEMHYFKSSTGGKKFYETVEAVLNDPTAEAVELAEFLFTCMGLGFQGELLGEPRELERRRRQLFEKARLAGKLGAVLAPEAYGRNSAKDLTKLPTVGTLRLILISVAALIFAAIAVRTTTSLTVDEYRAQVAEAIELLEGDGGGE